MDHSNFAYAIRNWQAVGLTFDADRSFDVKDSELRRVRLEHPALPSGAIEGIGLTLKNGDESILILGGDEFWEGTATQILQMIPLPDHPSIADEDHR